MACSYYIWLYVIFWAKVQVWVCRKVVGSKPNLSDCLLQPWCTVGCWTMQYVSKILNKMKSYQCLLYILSSLVLCWSDSQCMLLPWVPKEWQEEIWVSYTLCVVYDKHVCSGMYTRFLSSLDSTPHTSIRLSWRKLTLPLNTSCMGTQPHTLLAMRTTWTTQIACLASKHCTALMRSNQGNTVCLYRWWPQIILSIICFSGLSTTINSFLHNCVSVTLPTHSLPIKCLLSVKCMVSCCNPAKNPCLQYILEKCT